MAFIIVKNAGVTWPYYFIEDPKKGNIHPSYSCHETYTGKELNIKPYYENYEEAKKDCDNLNKHNPSGDYDICVRHSCEGLAMEIRIFRTWSYVPDRNGRLAGAPQYVLIHHDQLQYKEQSWMDWKPVPIVEGEKPPHPDDLERKKDLQEIDDMLSKAIADGTIKLPKSLDLSKSE